MNELPSLKERVLNLASESWEWFKEGAPVTDRDSSKARLDHCFDRCPHFIMTEEHPGYCRLCGCPMARKVWLATASCPDTPPRWKAITSSMDRPFFGWPTRQRALLLELETWKGTRFFRRSAPAVKGVRADCVSFVEAVLVNLGAISPIAWPDYVTHYGGEAMLELMIKTLDAIPELKAATPDKLLPGDLLACSAGKNLHHLALFSGGNVIWHAWEQGGGVCTANSHDPLFRKNLVAVYRAYE